MNIVVYSRIISRHLEGEHFGRLGDFLTELKKEFSSGDNETIKVAKLKKVEQESRKIKKFL